MPLAAALLFVIQSSNVWLDQPLANWNKARAPVPTAPAPEEPLKAVASRCRLTPPATGPAGAIAAAGWLPFNYFGQPITQDNMEIVGGMTGADGMCRPTQYNVFVFVAGRFAGTLSPALMTSREDGSSARCGWTRRGSPSNSLGTPRAIRSAVRQRARPCGSASTGLLPAPSLCRSMWPLPKRTGASRSPSADAYLRLRARRASPSPPAAASGTPRTRRSHGVRTRPRTSPARSRRTVSRRRPVSGRARS